MKSRLPTAEEFQDWISEDVLPSIRKTGKYVIPGAMKAIDNIRVEELCELTEDDKKEARKKLVNTSDKLKDPEKVRLGRKGGLVTQEKIRETKEELEKKEDEIIKLKIEVSYLKEIKERMSDTKKEFVQDLYDAALLTSGVVGISYAAKTIAGKSLGAPMTLEGAMKLGVAVAGSSVVIAYLKDKGAGFLFSHLNQNGYKKEVKRHNHALEELAAAKEKFYESE
ncbi:Hypothetical predicted protein, partial [Paramuricea clavata]